MKIDDLMMWLVFYPAAVVIWAALIVLIYALAGFLILTTKDFIATWRRPHGPDAEVR